MTSSTHIVLSFQSSWDRFCSFIPQEISCHRWGRRWRWVFGSRRWRGRRLWSWRTGTFLDDCWMILFSNRLYWLYIVIYLSMTIDIIIRRIRIIDQSLWFTYYYFTINIDNIRMRSPKKMRKLWRCFGNEITLLVLPVVRTITITTTTITVTRPR